MKFGLRIDVDFRKRATSSKSNTKREVVCSRRGRDLEIVYDVITPQQVAQLGWHCVAWCGIVRWLLWYGRSIATGRKIPISRQIEHISSTKQLYVSLTSPAMRHWGTSPSWSLRMHAHQFGNFQFSTLLYIYVYSNFCDFCLISWSALLPQLTVPATPLLRVMHVILLYLNWRTVRPNGNSRSKREKGGSF